MSGKKIQNKELERRDRIRKKAEAERARKLQHFLEEEEKKVEGALKDAKAYQDAVTIRAYAQVYFEKNSAVFEQFPKREEYYHWLLKRADWVDPLVENDYDAFLKPQ